MLTDVTTIDTATRAARARELYNRLPEVYRERDWRRVTDLAGEDAVREGRVVPELEAFLGIVADEIIRLREHIGNLWDDLFIETCDEWVVPYIAELLGVAVVFNAAQRNRVDVRNTIDWRRRKGTLPMLAKLAGDITGWGADATEFFENMGWAQNIDHVKADHFQAARITDPVRISLLGTAADPWLHSADVRRPQGARGWYSTRTIGFPLARLKTYPLRGVTPCATPRATAGQCFNFDPLGRDVPLYSRATRQPVLPAAYAADPASFVGNPDAFTVRQHGIPLAVTNPALPEPTEPRGLWSGFGPAALTDPATALDGTGGLEYVVPEQFETPGRHFRLTALWGSDFADPLLTALGSLAGYPVTYATTAAATRPGVFMVRIELAPGSDAAMFPECVVAVRNNRSDKRAADSRDGRYRDALYVYLPRVPLAATQVVNLYIADDGSTYWAHRAAPHVGPADVVRADLQPRLDRALVAHRALGQCMPARRLASSFTPSDVANLHRVAGLRLADEGLFASPAREFMLQAWQYGEVLGPLVGQLRTYTDSSDPAHPLPAFQYVPWTAVDVPVGSRLILSVGRRPGSTTTTYFPMTELILTERNGRALLVALPELDFSADTRDAWLFFDTEGATYYASTNFGHDTALSRPLRGSALRFDPTDVESGLARKSAGQVLRVAGTIPVRQRQAICANLCHWDAPKPRPPRVAQLAIDPARGRFCFARGEIPAAPLDPRPVGASRGLSVDYHEAFADDVGALTYERFSSLASAPPPATIRHVNRSGDAHHDPATVYATLTDAVSSARDGDVIQIEDSATYDHVADLMLHAGVRRLVIQSANRQRPCLRFASGRNIRVPGAMDALRINGLLVSGGALVLTDASQVRVVEVIGCSFDPAAANVALVAAEGAAAPTAAMQVSLCRCIVGGLQLGSAVGELVVSDSILDRPGGAAIANPAGGEPRASAHLERTTMWGTARVHQLYASECILVDTVHVTDQQTGCLRYTRYRVGSHLPRRFKCVPPANDSTVDALVPRFVSHRFGRPEYAQLHDACPQPILTGAEDEAEMGAFHGALGALRESNLLLKLEEYLAVGLTPAIIHAS